MNELYLLDLSLISSTVTIIFATSNVIILVYPIGIVITIGFVRLPYNGIEINLVIDSTYLPASSRSRHMERFVQSNPNGSPNRCPPNITFCLEYTLSAVNNLPFVFNGYLFRGCFPFIRFDIFAFEDLQWILQFEDLQWILQFEDLQWNY